MCMYCVIALAGSVGALKIGANMLKAKKNKLENCPSQNNKSSPYQ
jgi:hypothetical protein